jgi:hypothetical protein
MSDPAPKRLAAVVAFGSVIAILDTTVVAVSLDTLRQAFTVQVSTVQWAGYLHGAVVPVDSGRLPV